MTRIMMATVPHVTSGSGLRKFQADGFLFNRVYKSNHKLCCRFCDIFRKLWEHQYSHLPSLL